MQYLVTKGLAERLIDQLTHEAIHIRDGLCDDEFHPELLIKAAQRLREQDETIKQQINDYGRGMAIADMAAVFASKPDCVWQKVGETFDTACNARYRDGAYSVWKTCPNCGGAVKSGGTHDQ